jgi:hypothetical protein
MKSSRNPAVRSITATLFFVYVVAGVGEKRYRGHEDIERRPVAAQPSHSASRKNDRHVMRAGRRDAIPLRAPAIWLSRIQKHSEGHRLDDWPTTANMIAVGA